MVGKGVKVWSMGASDVLLVGCSEETVGTSVKKQRQAMSGDKFAPPRYEPMSL